MKTGKTSDTVPFVSDSERKQITLVAVADFDIASERYDI
jgi:hypothetical protein